jgi:hypothetical protein
MKALCLQGHNDNGSTSKKRLLSSDPCVGRVYFGRGLSVSGLLHIDPLCAMSVSVVHTLKTQWNVQFSSEPYSIPKKSGLFYGLYPYKVLVKKDNF